MKGVISERVGARRRMTRGDLWAWGFVGAQVVGFFVALAVDGGGFDECEVRTSGGRVIVQWGVAAVSLGVPAVALRWSRPSPTSPYRRLFTPLAVLAILLAGLFWLILLLPRVC